MGRNCHTACLYKDFMIVFGGKEGEVSKRIVNKLLIYSFSEDKWYKPEIKGKIKPEPRMGHTACIYKDYMIINGGWSGKYVLNDTIVLDLSKGINELEYKTLEDLPVFKDTKESKFDIKEEVNSPYRQFHSANIIEDKMYTFGGGDGRSWLDDLYVLDLSK